MSKINKLTSQFQSGVGECYGGVKEATGRQTSFVGGGRGQAGFPSWDGQGKTQEEVTFELKQD